MMRPPAIIGVGRNYAKHAAELGNERPTHPLIFYKNPASLCANGSPIMLPRTAEVDGLGVDYEGELAVILGEDVRDVAREDALGVVSHYAVANDVSHRWWQWEGSGGQFCRGKSFDSFCPLSEPVDAASIVDPHALRICTRLNGVVVQDDSTSQMLFSIDELIAELSKSTTLLAGTIILTGTPSGVGAASDPPRFLMAGDTIEVEIEHVGLLRNRVVA